MTYLDKLVDYTTNTPHNTNAAVVRSLAERYAEESTKGSVKSVNGNLPDTVGNVVIAYDDLEDKPFYEELVEEVFIGKQMASFIENNGEYVTMVIANDSTKSITGDEDEICFVIDGVYYTFTPPYNLDEPFSINISDERSLGCLCGLGRIIIVSNDTSNNHSPIEFEVIRRIKQQHTLDVKFLPEGYPNKVVNEFVNVKEQTATFSEVPAEEVGMYGGIVDVAYIDLDEPFPR